MDEKPKRQLTETQLENLKKGREKVRQLHLQSKEITKVKELIIKTSQVVNFGFIFKDALIEMYNDVKKLCEDIKD